MGPTEKFIKGLGKTNHPLGKPVREEEVDSLVQNLMTRLDLTRKELDFSPGSISKLEKALTLLRDRTDDDGKLLHPDDIVLLVREITAYIGMILVLHVQGKWDDGAIDLWSTAVVIPGPWQVHKDQNFVTDASSIFIIGGEAAYTWDRILDGQKPKLKRVYKEAVTKTLREF